MKNKELAIALKQLKNISEAGAIDKEFVKNNREILLMQIKNTSSQEKCGFNIKNTWRFFESIVPETTFKYIVRPVLTGVMIFAVFFGGWSATVSASYNSLPGDALYGLKILAERAQLSLTSKKNKPSLQVEFVGRRVEEIAKIAEQNSVVDKEGRTKKAVNEINKQLIEVKTSLNDLHTEEDNQGVVEVAKLVDRKTAEYSSALDQIKDNLPAEVKSDVNKVSDSADDAGIKAIEVIVKKYTEGNGELSEKEILDIVEEKLKVVEGKIVEVDKKINSEVDNKEGSTVEKEISKEAKNALSKAKEALDNNDIDIAVEKLVEAKNIVNGVIMEDGSEENVVSSTIESNVEDIAGEAHSN